MGPEFIIRIKDEPTPRPVEFGELFDLRDKLQSLTLLWTCNSYHVNRDIKYFLINGGRRVGISDMKGSTDLKIFCRRRHQRDVTFGGQNDEGAHRVSYLLGITGTVDGEEKTTCVHVTEDGVHWVWRDGI